MPRRAILLLLAASSAVCGCGKSQHGSAIVSYSPGQKPTSRNVLYDATVELYARGQPEATGPLTSTGVTSGTRVGFRREPDGSVVAFVGERPVAIPECRCDWVIVESSWPRWWSRRGEDIDRAAEATGMAIYLAGIAIGATAYTAAYVWAGGVPVPGGTSN